MAEAKSIIEIDVRDQAFRDFTELFQKYQVELAALPGSWGKVDRVIKATKNPFTQIDAVIKGTVDKIKKAATAQDKFRVAAIGSGKAFGIIATSAGKTAKSVKEITLGVMKWASLGSVFSGLLAGGTLFGVDRLALAAGESRRAAQGLGITAGEHEAAKISYGRLVDVDPMLAKINEMRNDLTQQYKFGLLGLKPSDYSAEKSNTDILSKVIPALKSQYEKGGKNKQLADAFGLTDFASIDELTRLSKVTKEEISGLEESNKVRQRELSIIDDTQKRWQDMSDQLRSAKVSIENTFVSALLPLAAPLKDLSAAFEHAVKIFLGSDKIKKWLDGAGDGLERFAKYLTSDDLDHDIKSFLDAIDVFAGALWSVAKTIGKVFNFGNEKGLKASQYSKLEDLAGISPELARKMEFRMRNPSWADNAKLNREIDEAKKGITDPNARATAAALIKALQDNAVATHQEIAASDRLRPFIDAASARANKSALKLAADAQISAALPDVTQLMGLGWTKAQALGIEANIQRESSNDSSAIGDSGRAYGLAQWHQDRQADFEKWAGHDIQHSTREEQVDFIDYELRKGKETGAGDRLKQATDASDAAAIISRYYERPAAADAEAAKRAQIAGAPLAQESRALPPLNVSFFNQTGGNVFATVNGMAYT